MPQVDLSTVCAAATGITPDRKVACETAAASIATADSDDPPPPPIDYAPESFYLSKDAEIDWLDQNAFIERRNSGKGSNSVTPNPNSNSHSNSNSIYGGSQRLKSKASILSLPNPQKQNYAGGKNRRSCKPASVRLFPKRSESINRKAVSEPSSPKVSCMGRVRSRKDRKNQTEPNRTDLVITTTSVKKSKSGFWSNFRSIFRGDRMKAGCMGNEPVGEPVRKKASESEMERKKCNGGASEPVLSEPPGLGAMNRFASGRRSDGWASEMEMKSEALDRSPIWRRREKVVGPGEVDVIDRDWQAVGPATV